MTPRIASFQRLLPIGCALVAAACSGPPSVLPPERQPGAPLAAEPFSGERAWAHLVALSDLGPRPSESPAHEQALEYLRSRLEELDIQVVDLSLATSAPIAARVAGGSSKPAKGTADASGGLKAHHLVAHIPGESPDVMLLLAHYDTLPDSVGANDGASGAALLLELARQLSQRPLYYTTDLVFLDREMTVDPEAPTKPLLIGSDLLSGHLQHTGVLDTIRLAVVFREVGDADLTIARDLYSDRGQREAFFDAAEALGLGDAFPRDRGYTEIQSSHRAFLAKGMRHVVAIQDPWYGGSEPPGEYWGAADLREHCSAQSLETVGVVALTALRRISEQLEKIDRISGRTERRRMEVMEPAEITGEAVDEPPQTEAPSEAEPGPAADPEVPQPGAADPEVPQPGADGPEAADPAPESS